MRLRRVMTNCGFGVAKPDTINAGSIVSGGFERRFFQTANQSAKQNKREEA